MKMEKISKILSNVTLADTTIDINSLPEEILIEIFDYLDKRSRNVGTRTCLKWQHSLLTDSRFAKYHQLTLDNNVALEIEQEPVSIFMESGRKFGVLRLGDVKFGPDLETFWDKMTKTVTHLIIKEFYPYSIRSYYLAEIIAKFTRLRVLEIEKYYVDREIIRIEKKLRPYAHKWPTVKTLKLLDSKFEPENYDFFETMMPNLEEIYFEKFLYSEDLVKKYASRIKSINVGYHFSSMAQLTDLVNLTHFELVLDTQYDGLVRYINKHPTLKSISVSSHCFPRDAIPKLHKLHLDLPFVINSFAPLRDFPELRELHVKLSNYDSSCFFGHEIITSPNLETLSLWNYSSGDCKKCQMSMFHSFPNLKSFLNESCFVSSADVIELISKFAPKLEHLTNKNFVTENFCLNDSLLKWAEMKNLRTCFLNPVGAVSLTTQMV